MYQQVILAKWTNYNSMDLVIQPSQIYMQPLGSVFISLVLTVILSQSLMKDRVAKTEQPKKWVKEYFEWVTSLFSQHHLPLCHFLPFFQQCLCSTSFSSAYFSKGLLCLSVLHFLFQFAGLQVNSRFVKGFSDSDFTIFLFFF